MLDILLQPQEEAAAPDVVRPLLQLLRIPEPEDTRSRRAYESELRVADDQYRDEHPLGLRQEEISFSLETADEVYAACAAKLESLLPYFRATRPFLNNDLKNCV